MGKTVVCVYVDTQYTDHDAWHMRICLEHLRCTCRVELGRKSEGRFYYDVALRHNPPEIIHASSK